MQVIVGGTESKRTFVSSGVPQGSVLGPLLFVLFINDLPDGIISNLKLFADDLKLVCNVNKYSDITGDLRLLEEWQNTWLLKFNTDKCKVLHVVKNNNSMNKYYLDNVEMKAVTSECDLGVLTNDKFSWDENIKSSISKANSMIGWVSRSIIDRSEE